MPDKIQNVCVMLFKNIYIKCEKEYIENSDDNRQDDRYIFHIVNDNIIITQHHNIMSIFSPAFCNTTCASIDLLMFDEHTVPNDNFDGWRSASGGGIPGGVDERCRPGTFMAKV